MQNPENRKLIQGKCSECKKEIWKREIHFKIHSNNFCSRSCQSLFKKTGRYVACSCCGDKIWKTNAEQKRSKSGNFFCSRSCATSFNNKKYKSKEDHPNFKNGIGSYRERAIKKYGAECSCCGYDKFREVLEVHHKDKDRTNNKISNLEVLCSNCHKEKHLK